MANKVDKISMGLGDAIIRLIKVFQAHRTRQGNVQQRADEIDMIVAALNQTVIDIGLDCDDDGIADVPMDQVFHKSVTTSCCRILPKDSSRKATSSSRGGKISVDKKPRKKR